MYALNTYIDNTLVNTHYYETKEESEHTLTMLQNENRYLVNVNGYDRNISWLCYEVKPWTYPNSPDKAMNEITENLF